MVETKFSNGAGSATTETIEIKGFHQYTLYDADDYVVAKYTNQEDNKTIVACGQSLPQTKDVTIVLNGIWENSKHGKRFNVAFFSSELPTSEKGIISYLSSLKARTGAKKARDIYSMFGEDTWNVIMHRPEELLKVKGITPFILNKLKEKVKDTNLLCDLMALFKGVIEISTQKAKNIENTLGGDALHIIKSDPYRLCEVRDFGFPSVDKLAIHLGIDPSNPSRLAASIEYLFHEAASFGHTCVPKTEMVEKMTWLLNEGLNPKVVKEAQCLDSLEDAWRQGKVKKTGKMLYSDFRYNQEVAIANKIAALMSENTKITEGIDVFINQYEQDNSIQLAESQKNAIKEVFRHQVNIITGGPGTGKTTIIKAVLFVHKMVFGTSSNPMLLAPTGRAARRMTEATGFEAATIHSAIGYRGQSEDKELEGEMLETNLLIVDEVSMMNQFTAYSLMNRIPGNAKVIFVGDPEQLPSVGCGNILHEMIRSTVVPTTRLDVIFRQAQDNPIVWNSQAIKSGDVCLRETSTFKVVEKTSAGEIFIEACSLYVKSAKAYGLDNVVLLNPYRDKSDLNVDTFNRNLQHLLNPKRDDELTVKVRNTEYRRGDKVMQRKNTDSAKNGDIGYIKEIIRKIDPDDTTQFIVVAHIEFNNDGNILTYDAKDISEQLDLAYCNTVHKSQGSEYETVIMVVSNMHEMALRRNVIYTGITRAQKNVAIVGERAALNSAIENNTTNERYTLLADRLYNLLK